MKKSLLTYALSLGLMGSALAQSDNGHFSARYAQGVRQNDVVAYCRTQLPNLCEGSTFEVTRDHTDRNGVRHLTLQQYVDGISVKGKSLQVHMRQGAIISIQGNVMTQQMAAAPNLAKRAPRRAADILKQAGLSETLAVKAQVQLKMIGGECRQVYIVRSGMYRYTLDAVSGEVLAKKSIIVNLNAEDDDEDEYNPVSVEGTAQTFYSGLQSMTCTQVGENLFALFDLNRGIYVLDSSYETLIKNGLTREKQSEVEDAEDMDAFNEYIQACEPYTNDSKDWTDTRLGIAIDSLTFRAYGEKTLATGKYLFADLTMENGGTYRTDTVLVNEDYNSLHFPATVETEIGKAVLELYTYNPETGTSDEYFTAELKKQYNTMLLQLTHLDEEEDYDAYLKDIGKNGTMYLFFSMLGYQPCTDVLWGMQKTLDYYKEVFDHDSFDGKGSEVYCFCNPPSMIFDSDNACAIPIADEDVPGLMMYGMGGQMCYPIVQLPIMGHEFTHLVARNLSIEEDDGEDNHCGALNESFADIMGMAIARWATGVVSWTVGEGVVISGKGIRSFENPEQYGDPSCYMDDNFDTLDYEVHCNAGVQNHMFYLLVTGGEGVNSLGDDYYVAAMDRTEAEALAYSTLVDYTYGPMSYENVAEAWAAAAAAMFGENSAQLKSVQQAWAAVGLGNGDITSIEQISRDRQTISRRYNLQGQPVGAEYRGLFIER